MSDSLPWHAPITGALRVALCVASHTGLALFVIAMIHLVAIGLHDIGDPKLFDIMPIRYVFDFMDALVLLMFIVYCARELIRVAKE